MAPEDYFAHIISQLMTFLVPPSTLPGIRSNYSATPERFGRAASFTVSRLLISSAKSHKEPASTVLSLLHSPFNSMTAVQAISIHALPSLTPASSIHILTALLTTSDPSPPLLQCLIHPILEPLYYLSFPAPSANLATLDPELKEFAKGLLKSWARLVSVAEAVEEWWGALEGRAGWGMAGDGAGRRKEWSIVDGELRVVLVDLDEEGDSLPLLSILATPQKSPTISISTTLDDEQGHSRSSIDPLPTPPSFEALLRPDPKQFVATLKQLGRKEVSSALFVRALEAYGSIQKSPSSDSLK